MSATKVLDQAEKLALLDAKVIAALRKQVAESKFVVTPEALAKVLVDNGHLTAFQARKLVAQALEEAPTPESVASAAPASKPAVSKPPAPARKPTVDDNLGFADEPSSNPKSTPPVEEEEILELEAVPPPAAAKKPAPQSSNVKPAAPSPTKPAAQRPAAKPPAPSAPKPKPPAQPDDDVIDLEAAVPAPAGYKPSGPALQPLPSPMPSGLQPLPSPRPAPTLTPVPQAPAPVLQPLPSPLQPALKPLPSPPAPGPALQPLGGPPPGGGLTPLAPLGGATGADPFGSPPGGFNDQQPGAAPKKQKKSSNRWDSPWLFVGGTALGLILVAFGLLYLSLTRGSAAQVFQKAEEQYNAGSYSNAYAAFDKFAKSFPTDPQAPRARVRRNMSRLRQVSEGGKNPREALKVAKEVLPEALKEGEAFNEARLELASILPEIADEFATQAKAAQDVKKRQELVNLTEEALQLVNLPDYIPPNLRSGQQSKIDAIGEKLLQARRTIDQEQESATTLAKIQQLISEGRVVEAYQTRSDLLKRFPGLETQTALVAATSSAAAKEKDLVKVVDRAITPVTTEQESPSQPVVLADRQGQPAPGVEGRRLAVLIQGALYGFDAKTGKALWRRFVGLESMTQPQTAGKQAGADIYAIDARDHSLLRLEAATGGLKWRLPIGEPFVGPTIAGERLYLATAQGQIIEADASTGQTSRAVQLPQGLAVAPTYDAKRNVLFQMGKHSTLFVIAADTLACQETLYQAHKAMGVAVSPLVSQKQLLIIDNAGMDYSFIHFYSTGEDSGAVKAGQESIRLKGRVVTPAGAHGNRVVIVTDLGEIVVLEIDSSNAEKPIQIVGRESARLSEPRIGYQVGNDKSTQLWVASGHLARYEVQASLQQLGRKWVVHNGDEFLAPLQLFDKTLFHVRKQSGAAGVTVEACNSEDGKGYWSTQIAAPMAGLSADAATGRITAISSRGAVFELADKTATSVEARWHPPAEPYLRLSQEVSLPAVGAVCLPREGATHGLLLSSQQEAPRVVNWYGDLAPAAAPTPFQRGLLVPLRSGRVQLVDPASGEPQLLPFMPTLEPGKELEWTKPAVLADQPNVFFIADQNRRLFRVGVKDQPQVHLAELAQGVIESNLIGPLIPAGQFLYSVITGDDSDVLIAISPKTLATAERWSLPGRLTGGPWAVGELAVVSCSGGQLLCIAGNQLRWTTEPGELQPVAAPFALEQQLVVTTPRGGVYLVDLATGQLLASSQVGQPLGLAIAASQGELLIAGTDGVLHRIAMPRKS